MLLQRGWLSGRNLLRRSSNSFWSRSFRRVLMSDAHFTSSGLSCLDRDDKKEGTMRRELVLKVVLVLVGLLFTAMVYPLIGGLLHPPDSDTGDTMMMSLYFALGVFLLMAVRNPSM